MKQNGRDVVCVLGHYAVGVFVKKNLSLHSIHQADLDRTLREEGIDDYSKVKSIWYEVDGKISLVRKTASNWN